MNINFLRYTPIYFFISSIFIIPGLISLLLFGLKPGIDFTGGSLMEVTLTNTDNTSPSEQQLLLSIGKEYEIVSIQQTNKSYLVRSKDLTSANAQSIVEILSKSYTNVDLIRFETVGPILGKELITKTYTAVVIACLAILLYVAYRFSSLKYGACAVIAMLHDTAVVIGTFSILGHFFGVEIDTLFVTAVLTILSFSVHDTIVVFDRIRESLHIYPKATYPQIINKSIIETMSRSINNSMTIIFMLLALYLLGGDSIKWFVFALLIGTITGTYSSTFTAAPLLVIWDKYLTKNYFRK